MEKSFTFTTPDAIEIAYIVQRSQDNPQFMHDMLLHAEPLKGSFLARTISAGSRKWAAGRPGLPGKTCVFPI